jgi:hypothetical protein
MNCRVVGPLVLALTSGGLFSSEAQEGTWSVSASVGYARLGLSQVEDDNGRDVEFWRAQGFSIPPLASLKNGLEFAMKAVYRYDRDFALTVAVSTLGKRVSSSSATTDEQMNIRRSVGYTDVMVGLMYHMPVLLVVIDPYFGAEAGILLATAEASTFGTRTLDLAQGRQTVVVVDSRGSYRGSKTIVSALAGTTVRFFSALIARAEFKYRVAPMGKLRGDVTRSGQTTEEATSIEFDLSGFVVSFGIGVEF